MTAKYTRHEVGSLFECEKVTFLTGNRCTVSLAGWKLRAVSPEAKAMLNQVIHNATITLQLPLDMGASAEIAALRSAGIPVDELGNATAGYLFVRTTGRGDHQTNTFRWFAASIGKTPAVASPPMPVSTPSGAPAW